MAACHHGTSGSPLACRTGSGGPAGLDPRDCLPRKSLRPLV